MTIKPDEALEGKFLLQIPRDELKASKNKIEIEIFEGDRKINEVKTMFLGPELR